MLIGVPTVENVVTTFQVEFDPIFLDFSRYPEPQRL